jgi:hypothetical protein
VLPYLPNDSPISFKHFRVTLRKVGTLRNCNVKKGTSNTIMSTCNYRLAKMVGKFVKSMM